MARKGKNFELAYKWLYDLDNDKYKVTSPAFLYDPFSERKREIDVLVEFSDNDNCNRKEDFFQNDKDNSIVINNEVHFKNNIPPFS